MEGGRGPAAWPKGLRATRRRLVVPPADLVLRAGGDPGGRLGATSSSPHTFPTLAVNLEPGLRSERPGQLRGDAARPAPTAAGALEAKPLGATASWAWSWSVAAATSFGQSSGGVEAAAPPLRAAPLAAGAVAAIHLGVSSADFSFGGCFGPGPPPAMGFSRSRGWIWGGSMG